MPSQLLTYNIARQRYLDLGLVALVDEPRSLTSRKLSDQDVR